MARHHFTSFSIFLLLSLSTSLVFAHFPAREKFPCITSIIPSVTLSDSLEVVKEQVVLHVANNYLDDDILFFKSYVFPSFNFQGMPVSDVLVVELLDTRQEVLKTQFHKITNGQVNGTMKLDKKIEPGKYELRAYTQRMKNYSETYAKQTVMLGESGGLEENLNAAVIAIVPESGVLLNGYENRLTIALKEGNQMNLGVVGMIVDDRNNAVAEIYKHRDCVAATLFTPKDSEKYSLAFNNGLRYPVPAASNSGYQLQVNSIDSEKIKIRLRATQDLRNNEAKLLAKIGGQTYLEAALDFTLTDEIFVELKKENFPDGIFNFDIVDASKRVWVSRPFVINRKPIHIKADLVANEAQGKTVKLTVTDRSGNPVQTKLSVSLNPIMPQLSGTNSCKENDVFNLFTAMDRNGTLGIKDERKELFLNDLNVQLMFAEYEALTEVMDTNMSNGLQLMGYAYDLKNNLLPKTTIQVLGMSANENIVIETETDANGLLSITNLDITGETELVFRTKGDDSKERLVKVKQVTEAPETVQVEDTATRTTIPFRIDRPVNSGGKLNTMEANTIELDEVAVSDKKKENYYSASNYSLPETSSLTRVKYQDSERPKTIELMLAEFAGVQVRNMGTHYPSVSLPRSAGPGPILYVIDGIALSQEPLPGLTPLAEVLSMVTAADVHKIELFLGPDAAVFGARGAGGAISITTRHGAENESIKRKEGTLTFKGYEPEIDFETYYTDISKRQREKLNLVYWNPSLETDKNGEVLIPLNDAQNDTELNLKVYTITPQGASGKLITSF